MEDYGKAVTIFEKVMPDSAAELQNPRMFELSERCKIRREELEVAVANAPAGSDDVGDKPKPPSMKGTKRAWLQTLRTGGKARHGVPNLPQMWSRPSAANLMDPTNSGKPTLPPIPEDGLGSPSSSSTSANSSTSGSGRKDGKKKSDGKGKKKSSNRKSRGKGGEMKPPTAIGKSASKADLSATDAAAAAASLSKGGVSRQVQGYFSDFAHLQEDVLESAAAAGGSIRSKSGSLRRGGSTRRLGKKGSSTGSLKKLGGKDGGRFAAGATNEPEDALMEAAEMRAAQAGASGGSLTPMSLISDTAAPTQPEYSPSPVFSNARLKGDDLAAFEGAIQAVLFSGRGAPNGVTAASALELLRLAFKVKVPEYQAIRGRVAATHGPRNVMGEMEARMELLEKFAKFDPAAFESEESWRLWKTNESEEVEKVMGGLQWGRKSDKSPARSDRKRGEAKSSLPAAPKVPGSSRKGRLLSVFSSRKSSRKSDGGSGNTTKGKKGGKGGKGANGGKKSTPASPEATLSRAGVFTGVTTSISPATGPGSGSSSPDGSSKFDSSKFDAADAMLTKGSAPLLLKAPGGARPRLTSVYTDHHKLFALLMHTVVQWESFDTREEWEITEEADVRLPSPSGGHILDSYADLFGIQDVYARIVFGTILAQHFEHTTYHLKLVAGWMAGIKDSLEEALMLTHQEQTMYQDLYNLLMPQVQNRLIKFKRCFPFNNPPGDLEKLVEVAKSLFQTKAAVISKVSKGAASRIGFKSGQGRGGGVRSLPKSETGHNPEDWESELTQFVTNALQEHTITHYEYLVLLAESVVAATSDSSRPASPSVMGPAAAATAAAAMAAGPDALRARYTAAQLISVIESVMDEMDELSVQFVDSFKKVVPKVDPLTLVGQAYFSLLLNDIAAFTDQFDQPEVKIDVFTLWTKSKELHDLLSGLASEFPPLFVSHMFAPLVYRWIDETHVHLRTWTEQAVRLESWAPVSDVHLFSSSVVDVFSMVSQPLMFLDSLQLLQVDEDGRMPAAGAKKGDQSFMQYFTGIILSVVESYVGDMYTQAMEAFPDDKWRKYFLQKFPFEDPVVDPGKKTRRFLSPRPREPKMPSARPQAIVLPGGYATFLNNVETARFKLDELIADFADSFDDKAVGKAFRMMKRVLKKLLDALVMWLNLEVERVLEAVIDPKRVGQVPLTELLDPLLTFLDDKLLALVDSLQYEILQLVLKALWSAIVSDLETLTFAGLTTEQARALDEALGVLQEFFHADGNGLARGILVKRQTLVSSLLELHEIASEHLIDLYHGLVVIQDAQSAAAAAAAASGAMPSSPRRDGNDAAGTVAPEHLVRLLSCRAKHDKAAKDFLKTVKKSKR